MTVVQMAMQAGFPYTVLRDSVLSHPTMAEGLNVLFSTVKSADVAVKADKAIAQRKRLRTGRRLRFAESRQMV